MENCLTLKAEGDGHGIPWHQFPMQHMGQTESGLSSREHRRLRRLCMHVLERQLLGQAQLQSVHDRR